MSPPHRCRLVRTSATTGDITDGEITTHGVRPYTRATLRFLAGCHVDEAAVVPLERHRHGRGRAVPVLGDDQVRLARPWRLPLVRIFSMQEDDNIRVLLDRTGFTQVREH